ncbi:LysR family transcriptional regulator [Humitalea rosea]|uniref:LysR family transcriptional regulator n=1 Tax=Humitalea rosea TaxID=990373 RepID=A0A2W7IQC5_9PROT|nr:LysR substrate-binding domain-containing protein [Humitalea rosea]PZW48078.1 LysR family transcriptional regulator [Humitalea rosea]
MTLDQLRVFVAVAERQHVTRAAEALHIAQSAASAAVAALEAGHGIKLFHRVGRGIELTDAGQRFLGEAQAVLARADAAELTLAELGGLVRGVLSVQASQTIAGYWLPRHLVAFRRAHPGIEIRLAIGNTAQVAAAVHEGRAELGFVEGAVEDGQLRSTTVATDQLVLVVAPDHPWASTAGLTLARAAEQGEWVLREPGSGTRSAFEAALAAAGVPPGGLQVALELPSNEAVRAAVEAGMGATAISASVAVPSLEAGLLRQVKLALPERAFHVLRHHERSPSRAATALLALIAAA